MTGEHGILAQTGEAVEDDEEASLTEFALLPFETTPLLEIYRDLHSDMRGRSIPGVWDLLRHF